jgi:hypothetical protein
MSGISKRDSFGDLHCAKPDRKTTIVYRHDIDASSRKLGHGHNMTSENAMASGRAVPSVDGCAPELSIVMPCLNEADTIESCIRSAQRALAENDIGGEILIADNGSTDGSQDIATRLGARVIPVAERG